MMPLKGEEDGVSPVIGVVLMVAITVALAAVVAIVVTSSGDQLNEGSANAKVEFQSTSTGLVLKVEQISTDADIQVNGETVATISKGDAGKTISLPSAPGDKIVIVSGNRESSVLVSKTVDESESPDFITYYRFDESSGSSTVEDSSGNDNTGQVGDTSDVDFVDGAAQFKDMTSEGNRIQINDLDTSEDVSEVTVAMTFKANSDNWDGRVTGDSDLMEQDVSGGAFSVLTKGTKGGNLEFWAQYPGTSTIKSARKFDADGKHTYVATHDSDGFDVYVDGEHIGSSSSGTEFELGSLELGKDPADGYTDDNFVGKIYEFRMYYKAFDEGEVDTLFTSM